MLIRIDAPHFVAGIVFEYKTNNQNIEYCKVLDVAPIIKYMKKWSIDKVVNYCCKKKWKWEFTCWNNKTFNMLNKTYEQKT